MEFNLADLFEGVVAAVPDREALVVQGHRSPASRWTYRALDERVDRLAQVLRDESIGVGDHVGLHLRNGEPFVVAMLALFKLRAVPINVNYRYQPSELAHVFTDADLVAVLTEPDLEPMVDAASGGTARPSVLVTGEDLEARLAVAPATPVDVGPRSADDLYILYTGGTTGAPKGVVWRQEDIYFASLGGRGTPSQGVETLRRPEDVGDRARAGEPIMRRLPLCPLIHGGAMWIALQSLLKGGTLVLSTDRHFDAHRALALLADERVDLTMLIGDATARPLVDALQEDPSQYDLSALQVIASGGAVLSPVVRAAWHEVLPAVRVIDTFGASETGGQGRLRRTAGHGDGPVVQLLTDDHTAVLDDDGSPLPPGSPRTGRLARTGHIPLGYYNDPAKTAETFLTIAGRRWSVPGDLARVEADGAITLLGRGSACINTGGEKVFPDEVEAALKHHPAVFDAVVVGVPDERFGERVAAVISRRRAGPEGDDGTVDADRTNDQVALDVQRAVREHLAGYKVPRQWVVVDRVERFETGKPDYAWARSVALAGDAAAGR